MTTRARGAPPQPTLWGRGAGRAPDAIANVTAALPVVVQRLWHNLALSHSSENIAGRGSW